MALQTGAKVKVTHDPSLDNQYGAFARGARAKHEILRRLSAAQEARDQRYRDVLKDEDATLHRYHAGKRDAFLLAADIVRDVLR